jgi:hypothetical protein
MSALPAAIQNNTDQQFNETALETALRDYIVGSNRFRFGGIVNLLGAIAEIMEGESELEGDDFEKAAQFIDQCANQCDLKYQRTN